MSEINKMLTKAQVNLYNRSNMENEEETDYICYMCRNFIDYESSYSRRGYNLICCSCFDKMCDFLDISPSQLMEIIHTPYKIPRKAQIESLHCQLVDVRNNLDVTTTLVPRYSLVIDKYLKAYTSLQKIIKQLEKNFDINLKCEQNMNKKDIETGYQE